MKEVKELFGEFLGKFVKVVYDDFGKPQIAKGVLKKVNAHFIFIKGDFSDQFITVSKILKINSISKK